MTGQAERHRSRWSPELVAEGTAVPDAAMAIYPERNYD